ncbi:hypothetical protein MYX76_18935, partial [Desulfobacterota bacterium AH_259_B03_O07]|nr:hypothetical protein [Desulfobacterota bacterium AH_259_B03_O07]
AERGRRGAQSILFVTERCVFDLTAKGLRLIEVAPGVDVGRDIVQKMGFTPVVAEELGVLNLV